MAEEPNTNPAPDTPPGDPTAAAPEVVESSDVAAPTEATPTQPVAANEARPAAAASEPNSTTISQEELDALLASAGEKPAASAPRAVAEAAAPVEETDELAAEMAAAIAAEAAAKTAAAKPEPPTKQFHAPELSVGVTGAELATLEMLDDVELDVKVELGRADMYIEDILQLGIGSVVSLNKLAGDPVDVFVNERLVARGEVLVLNESFCVRINEIVSPSAEAEPAR